MLSPDARAALVIGHPGHELRVFHWLEVTQPSVFVLTDGSGRSGRSRLASTTRILEQTGGRPGAFYGKLSDSDAYAAILNRDADLFADCARQLARHFMDERIDYVVGDALEGYNPVHDLCRLIIGLAVEIANRSARLKIANYDFSLAGHPIGPPEANGRQGIRLQLDDDSMTRKLAAAAGYTEIGFDVQEAIGKHTVEAFRVECLRPVSNCDRGDRFLIEPPYYEQYGAQQVAAGHYREVIHYRKHFLSLASSLWQNLGVEG